MKRVRARARADKRTIAIAADMVANALDCYPCEARLAVCQRGTVELLDKLAATQREVQRWAERNRVLEQRLAAVRAVAEGRRV